MQSFERKIKLLEQDGAVDYKSAADPNVSLGPLNALYESNRYPRFTANYQAESGPSAS